MKVVINSCYGGFNLSAKGLKRYLELKGKQTFFYRQSAYSFRDGYTEYKREDNLDAVNKEFFVYCTTYDQGNILSDFPEDTVHGRDIERHDPALVQTVEELGSEASGKLSNLTVVEIENGRWFKIDEYDGYESIQYRDIDDEWILAQ